MVIQKLSTRKDHQKDDQLESKNDSQKIIVNKGSFKNGRQKNDYQKLIIKKIIIKN